MFNVRYSFNIFIYSINILYSCYISFSFSILSIEQYYIHLTISAQLSLPHRATQDFLVPRKSRSQTTEIQTLKMADEHDRENCLQQEATVFNSS